MIHFFLNKNETVALDHNLSALMAYENTTGCHT